ncbi:ribbon-helix-helix domain-containing protein [Sphingomonas sp. KRR8]|uniref:ribbon-helix-helix domain-containing protein n=1 Tax=Sphingomonas sp. KRR8 TaxID=2942996 RepID=UPI002021300B|nr:ribbon-helix-helix domain-containing protein [Sphingomonas sp. KRR8]URD62374.1 ribbon-helix-helix domain-containing protein [Sphingomonas sp. KRR8]
MKDTQLPETLTYSPPIKRSVLIAGHQTSVSLEPLFWRALEVAAADMSLPVNAVVALVDEERLKVAEPPNLTSALRQWLFGRALGD